MTAPAPRPAKTSLGPGADEHRVVAAAPNRLFVDGEWVAAEDGATFDVHDPATGEVLCAVADASPADGRRPSTPPSPPRSRSPATTPRQREECLTAAYDLLTSASTTWPC